MHNSALVFGSSHFLALFLASIVAAAAAGVRRDITPNHVISAPFFGITPAPDPDQVAQRLSGDRQGIQNPAADGRTDFIGWYVQSNSWVSATCPSQSYFAADETYGVCCPRDNPYCDMATSCGGPFDNYAIGPSGQADCGPNNTCDTITMLQTQGSTDARKIIFCIAISDLYILPKTWYRVTSPLPEASVAPTVTVTMSATVTETVQSGTRPSGQAGSPFRSPPVMMTLAVAAFASISSMMVP
ncbi:hypothetical protein EsH8_VI_001155 [Colletotrichum jinshuiense]